MIAWAVFAILSIASVLVCAALVPRGTLRRYARCPKPWYFWAAQVSSHGIWIVAAVQCWLAPSSFALPVRILGAVWMIAGSVLQIWAQRVNPAFLPVLVRPVWLVTTGPYALFDHPGYVGFALSAAGAYALLAQTWAFIPLGCYLGLLMERARAECRFLASLHKS